MKVICRKNPFFEVPYDCWGVILTFVDEFETYFSVVRTVPGLFDFLKRSKNSEFCINIMFHAENGYFPSHAHPHVSFLKFDYPKVRTELVKIEYGLINRLEMFEMYFFNLKKLIIERPPEYFEEFNDLDDIYGDFSIELYEDSGLQNFFHAPCLEFVKMNFCPKSFKECFPEKSRSLIKHLIIDSDENIINNFKFWDLFLNLETLEFSYSGTIYKTTDFSFYELKRLKKLKIHDSRMEDRHQIGFFCHHFIMHYCFHGASKLMFNDIDLTLSMEDLETFIEYLNFNMKPNSMKRLKFKTFPIAESEENDILQDIILGGENKKKWIFFPTKNFYDMTDEFTHSDTYNKKVEYFEYNMEVMCKLTNTEFTWVIKNQDKELSFHFNKIKNYVHLNLIPRLIKNRDECCDLLVAILAHKIIPRFEKFEKNDKWIYDRIILEETVQKGLLRHRIQQIKLNKMDENDDFYLSRLSGLETLTVFDKSQSLNLKFRKENIGCFKELGWGFEFEDKCRSRRRSKYRHSYGEKSATVKNLFERIL